MKSLLANSSQKHRRAAGRRAFSMVELLFALGIFLMVMAGVVSLPILGLKMNALSASKLKSTAASVKILNQIRNQVLEASSVVVGNGGDTTFAATGTTGNALQVYPPGGNTNNYIRFFLSTKTFALYEWYSTNNQLWLLAPNITNETVFQTVDFQGKTSSSSQEHYAIKMTLQFAQLNYKIPTNSYEYYTLETEMTPRGQ